MEVIISFLIDNLVVEHVGNFRFGWDEPPLSSF